MAKVALKILRCEHYKIFKVCLTIFNQCLLAYETLVSSEKWWKIQMLKNVSKSIKYKKSNINPNVKAWGTPQRTC